MSNGEEVKKPQLRESSRLYLLYSVVVNDELLQGGEPIK